jgi:predicted neuraminidase
MDFRYVESPETIVGQAHASTIVEMGNGDFLCAWFGGAEEGTNDVAIWNSRFDGESWGKASVLIDHENIPCGNPVLFRTGDRTWLMYKSGPNMPGGWAGRSIYSDDDGKTWSDPAVMPAGIYGPVKNKPIILSDGIVLCPNSSENYEAWTGYMNLLDLETGRWTISNPIAVPGFPHGVIQPTVWDAGDGHIVALMRATQEIGRIVRSDSFDNGRTWSDGTPTDLPNNNSGFDAVKLVDGRVVLIYNHTLRADPHGGRYRIHLAVSRDDGDTWSEPWLLEGDERELSYPAIIEGSDGRVHMTYTWNRIGVRHAVFSPEEIDGVEVGTHERPA